jgi:hypothetical protein
MARATRPRLFRLPFQVTKDALSHRAHTPAKPKSTPETTDFAIGAYFRLSTQKATRARPINFCTSDEMVGTNAIDWDAL